MFVSPWSRAVVCGSLIALIGVWTVVPVQAQIIETRDSSANPMVEVFKSTIYGGLAGLLLGSAVALASNNDDNADTIKWSFVGGTFFGFGYGIYHVSTRSQARALLEHGEDTWALAMPTLTVTSAAEPRRPEAGSPVALHASLASFRF